MIIHVSNHKSISCSDRIVTKVVEIFVMLRVQEEGFDEEIVIYNIVVEHLDLRLSRIIKFLHNQIKSSIFIDIKECDKFPSFSSLISYVFI